MNTIEISLNNPQEIEDTYGLTGIVRLERGASRTGSFTSLTTIALDTDSDGAVNTHLEYLDTTGDGGHWYRYRVENAGATVVSAYSNPWPGRTPRTRTLQQTRQEVAGDMEMLKQGTFTTVTDANTVIDTKLISTFHTNDDFRGRWIHWETGNQVGRIGAFTPGTGAMEITPTFTATPTVGDAYSLYRWIDPREITAAINDALEELTYEDEFLVSGEENRKRYPVPSWLMNEEDILEVESLRSIGNTTGEGEYESWFAWGGQYRIFATAGEKEFYFWPTLPVNHVLRFRALRPYVTNYEERLTSESDVLFAPREDLIPGAMLGVYDRLIRAAGGGRNVTAWERERAKLERRWEFIKVRQHVWRSMPVRPADEVWVGGGF
jgi:hypothetical protein